MPLQVLPAVEADALRIAELERDAYLPSPVSPILFPGPHPADALEVRAAQMAESLRTDPCIRWFKVVDTDLPEGQQLIAFAQWNIYHPDPAPPAPLRSFGAGSNPAACEEYFTMVGGSRKRHMEGKTYIYLRYLEVDPAHQRRGAGRMLMKWGVDEAQRLGLPAWLESSPEGKRLYESCGFKVVERHEFDMSKYGVPGVHHSYAMIKELA